MSNFRFLLLILEFPAYYLYGYLTGMFFTRVYCFFQDQTKSNSDSIKNPYKILEIPRDADQSVIAKAWRRKALKTHPDKFPEEQKKQKTDEFREIAEAFELLSNPLLRREYDTYNRWSFGLTINEARSMYDAHFGVRPRFRNRIPPASQTIARARILTEEASRSRERRRAEAIARARIINR